MYFHFDTSIYMHVNLSDMFAYADLQHHPSTKKRSWNKQLSTHHESYWQYLLKVTLPETNIAHENPPCWWYLPGKMGIFRGYVKLREGTWHFTNSIFGHSFRSWTNLSSWQVRMASARSDGQGSLSFYEPWWVKQNNVWSMTKRWWLRICFGFSPPKLGEDEPILTNIFFKSVGSITN